MSLIDRIRIYPRKAVSDQRGALLKVLCGSEPELRREIGEIYVVWGEPGQTRGGHYHPLTDEFFTLIEGQCRLLLADPGTGKRMELALQADEPCTVHVPKGIAHAFSNATGATRFLLVAYADRAYDPADTVRFDCGS